MISKQQKDFVIGECLDSAQAMRLAIAQGRRGAGRVSPNPLVGCVILSRDNLLLATGYHHVLGQDHAEIDALKKIVNATDLEGAQLFVTLEPCAHQGRTPACAAALAKLPLGRVVYGLLDPNPKVAGKGAEILKAAGLVCESWASANSKVSANSSRINIPEADVAAVQTELEELCEIFLYNQRQRQAFVAFKMASSLDGVFAMRDGKSQWITSEESRQRGHELRSHNDAVLIGRQTFVDDNPSLNIRLPGFASQENKVVVLDPKGQIASALAASNLLKVRAPNNVVLVVASDQYDQTLKQLKGCPVQVLAVSNTPEKKLSIMELVRALPSKDVHSILIEGGAKTLSAFVQQRAVQRAHVFIAPRILGGVSGRYWSESIYTSSLSESIDFLNPSYEACGPDIYFTASLVPKL